MNEYKITYSGESEGYRIITDRTEAAAKKFFREDAKELGLGRITIESVELLSDNALASKRNERETLETIRQLVADLGPQSYLATAFEGCFEDAETNIENDFGDSWKRRCESVEQKLAEAERKIKALELDNRDLRNAVEKTKADLARAEQALKDRSLAPDDMADVRQLLEDRIAEADEKAEKAAAEIVRFAEAPNTPEFRQAVADHRNYLRDAEYTRKLLGLVVAAEAATHSQATKENQAA